MPKKSTKALRAKAQAKAKRDAFAKTHKVIKVIVDRDLWDRFTRAFPERGALGKIVRRVLAEALAELAKPESPAQ